MIYTQLQEPVPQWPEAIAASRQNAHHVFFQVENATEARNTRPDCNTHIRHFVDHQQPYLFAQDKAQAARDFFNRFVDGTFLQHAHNVDGVFELNEYFGNNDDPASRANKIEWAVTCASVWAHEYRTRPELAHIKLALARTAVGNDTPLEVARAAQAHDCYLAYHPYIPVRGGVVIGSDSVKSGVGGGASYYSATRASMRDGGDYVVSVGTAPPTDAMSGGGASNDISIYFHNRFTMMDEYYRANGVTVPAWLFSEAGAVGYNVADNGDIHLHPNDGWRSDYVLNGNLPAYINILENWANEVAAWNAANGNRVLGAQLFTTNTTNTGWHNFRTNPPDLTTIMAHFAQWEPPIPPPQKTDRQLLKEASDNARVLWFFKDAALYKAIKQGNRGGNIVTPEFNVVLNDGRQYVGQSVEGVKDDSLEIYYVPMGEWDNVKIEVYE